jgi:hypothetical protein
LRKQAAVDHGLQHARPGLSLVRSFGQFRIGEFGIELGPP